MSAPSAIFASLLTSPIMVEGWLPETASRAARTVDHHFTILIVFAASTFVLLLFAIDLLVFMNLRKGEEQVGTAGGDRMLYRGLAVALPLVVVMGVFAMGVDGYVDAAMAPTDAMTVEAHAGPEGWSFRYSDDVETDALHVPSERPVRLTLHSEDAPVALAIPAFRVRRNAKAGLRTEAWFQASLPGDYALLSSGPSLTRSPASPATVTVHPPADFDAWLLSKSDVLLSLPPAEAGRVLVERKGCLVCHTTDGSRLTGPSFKGLIGRESQFTDGTSSIVDAAYVRRSILEPNVQVVAGFEPVMTPFAGQIRDEEIDAIFTYFETLTEVGEAP